MEAMVKGKAKGIKFIKERDTKNTIRYREEPAEGNSHIVGTLYIQKLYLGDNPPDEITITINTNGK